MHFRNVKWRFILTGNIYICFFSSDFETFFKWVILWRKQPLATSTCAFNTRERSSKFKGMYCNNVFAFWTMLSRGYKRDPFEITLFFHNSSAIKKIISKNYSLKFRRLFNFLRTSPTKWPNLLKQFVGKYQKTFMKFLGNCKTKQDVIKVFLNVETYRSLGKNRVRSGNHSDNLHNP